MGTTRDQKVSARATRAGGLSGPSISTLIRAGGARKPAESGRATIASSGARISAWSRRRPPTAPREDNCAPLGTLEPPRGHARRAR
eukprot:scaffold27230_cov26-Tisochrysis_lutea.AAC.1